MLDEIGSITVHAHSLGRGEVVRRQVPLQEEVDAAPVRGHEGLYDTLLMPAPT